MIARRPLPAALALMLGLCAAPSSAETIAELEALSRGSATPGAGIALARRQMGRGELTDALATLERVLINHPQARDAQLLRAGVLCQLDDRGGSTAEFGQLRGRGLSERALDASIRECDALSRQRPAP